MSHKLEVLTYDDGHDCELCGLDMASGGSVLLNDVHILEYTGHAYCFGGSSYELDDIWAGINDECALGVLPEIDPEYGWDISFVDRCRKAVIARGWELIEDHEGFEWPDYDDDYDYPGMDDDDNCWCQDGETCTNCTEAT